MTILKRYLRDQSGSTAIEYCLIGALISLAILAGLLQLSANLDATFRLLGAFITGE
ncbi:Flp family type IVb pilin [Brucella sp. IR073]|uniref:Flp family type IVb pilin n=1 Tax=unclassified Brucella TaxID=2632610 RepID=UPI003B9839B3